MNVYDFDDTLFDHNSTSGFYFFALHRDLSLLRYLPKQLAGFIGYGLRILNITQMKDRMYCFLKGIKDPQKLAEEFWDQNISHIHCWYQPQQKNDDVVISGSPIFIVEPATRRLGIKYLIASEVDCHTGRVLSPNCSGRQKVVRFKECPYYGPIDNFYSDSHADQPLANLAKQAFLIKHHKIQPWPWPRQSQDKESKHD